MRTCEECGSPADRELVVEDVETGEALVSDYWLCLDCWGDLG